MTRIILRNSLVANKRPSPAALLDGELALNCAATGDAVGAYFRTSSTELVKVGPTHVGGTAPNSNPAGWPGLCIGEMWLKTQGGTEGLRVWDGSNWQQTSGIVGSTGVSTLLGVEAGASLSDVGSGSPVFIGYQSGKAMNQRVPTVAIGTQSLLKATSGAANNVAIGDQALSNLTTSGSNNTFVGYQAGLNAVGVSDAVAVGSGALQNALSGASTSVAIGANALKNATTGLNIAIGANQGVSVTTGTGNVLIGTGHPTTGGLTTGSNNIFLGHNTYGVGNASSNMVLANGWHVDTLSNGNTIIGSVPGDTTPEYTLNNNSGNTLIGVMGKNILGPGASGNTLIGAFGPTFNTITTNNNVILGNGVTFALWVNEPGAWGLFASAQQPPNYGTDGQILVSQGPVSPPTWRTFSIIDFTRTNTTGTFTSSDNKLITITNGLITAITPV